MKSRFRPECIRNPRFPTFRAIGAEKGDANPFSSWCRVQNWCQNFTFNIDPTSIYEVSKVKMRPRTRYSSIFPNPDPKWFKMGPDDVPVDQQRVSGLRIEINVRAGPFKYEELILVGHSEGGFILRRVIVDAVKAQKQNKPVDVLGAKLRLFAPALLGIQATGRLGMLYRFVIIGGIAKMWLSRGSAYQELKGGSAILDTIKDDTVALANADVNGEITALRALIIWGRNENIVQPGEYLCDTRYGVVANQNHVSICKPTDKYLTPLDFIHA